MFLTPEPDALIDILPIMINMGYGKDVYHAIATCKTLWEDKYIWQVVKNMPFGEKNATPLMVAATRGTKAHTIIKNILKRKGTLTAKDIEGSTPLFYASNADQPKTVKFLHSLGADIDEPDYEGFTPLLDSCNLGNFKTVKTLIALGANLNVRDRIYGCTPFLNAARGYETSSESRQCMLYLLKKGANIDEQDLFGRTALIHLAKCYWSYDEMEILIAKGASVELRDYEGETALHKAAFNGNYGGIKMLVKGGADVNVQCNSYGMTPLHQAAFNGDECIVKLLLEEGANARMLTHGAHTPMDFVRGEIFENKENTRDQIADYRAIAKLLFTVGGDPDAELPPFPIEHLWLAEMDTIEPDEDPMWLLRAARMDRVEPVEYGWPWFSKNTYNQKIFRIICMSHLPLNSNFLIAGLEIKSPLPVAH